MSLVYFNIFGTIGLPLKNYTKLNFILRKPYQKIFFGIKIYPKKVSSNSIGLDRMKIYDAERYSSHIH